MDSNRLSFLKTSRTQVMKPLQASKWLKIQVLLDEEEMQNCLNELSPFSLYLTGSVCQKGEEELPLTQFLKLYNEYVSQLKQGLLPDLDRFRHFFSVVLTKNPSAVFAVPLKENKQIMRVSYPCIQLQVHQMNVSRQERKFHPAVFGANNIVWGLQFSFPQLYVDTESGTVKHTMKDTDNLNTALFRRMQSWIRKHTVPTPFIIDDVLVNSSVRIGKRCFSWIAKHPQLIAKKIRVKGGSAS